MLKYFAFSYLIFSFNFIFSQEGLVKSYYENGKLKSEINFSNNVREGAAKFYYENGIIQEERNYINGKVEGLVKRYNKEGKLEEVFNIEDGKREGPTSLYDSAGVYLTDINFENGVRIRDIQQESSTPKIELKNSVATEKKMPLKTEKTKEDNPVPLPPSTEKETAVVEASYLETAEVMPEPVGGLNALQDRIFYPSLAKEKKIEGTVKVLAFIDQYGDVTKADVIQGIGYGCDESARITVLYSRFKPGLIKGKPVNIQMLIPITFKLK